MVGRRFVTLWGLVAVLAPAQVAFALPDLPPPPPPPPVAPPPPPTGLRPLVGPDGRMVTDAQGRPQFVIDLPAPPVAPARPTNVPQILMRHLPASPMPGVAGPGAPPPVALPVPAAGQGLRDVTQQRVVVPPPPPGMESIQSEPSSTLPQAQPVKPVQTPPPPPSEGGRRPGGPRGI